MDKGFFLEYARNCDRLRMLQVEVRKLGWRVQAMAAELKTVPEFPTTVSDHAALKATERIQEFADTCQELFSEIVNAIEPDMSLSLIANMKAFVIKILADAYVNKRFVAQQSKTGSTEWKYIYNVPGWEFSGRAIEIVACVEDNVVKTVFFNWKALNVQPSPSV